MTQNFTIFFILATVVFVAVFLYLRSEKFKRELLKERRRTKENEETARRKMYEAAVLKEIGERVGYSLNIEQIIDIITSSLRRFIEYSAVSYMLLEPEKIIFKVYLEKSVHRKFIDEIRDRMLKSLSALLNKELNNNQVEEVLFGAVLNEDAEEEPARSFFNVPLAIGDRVVGVFTVAHTTAGLYKEEEMAILYKIIRQASQAVTRLEEVVKTEQRKLNSMVESISEGVVMTDTNYRIVVANPAAKAAVGIEENKEPTIFDFIDNLDGKFDIRGKLEESVKLDRPLESGEVLIKDRYFQIFVSPVKNKMAIDEHAEILGAVAIFRDITHKKELDKLRDEFTSMMVHELRSPLDGIKKMAEFMKESDVEKEKEIFADYPSMIFESSSRMLELVNDLLDSAKLEAGKFKVNPTEADIKDIIQSRFKFYGPQARKAGIELSVIYGENIQRKVLLDSERFSQALDNLVSNSIKFTPPPGATRKGKIEIQVFAHKNGEDINKEAKDAGIKWFAGKEAENTEEKENPGSALIIAVTDNGVGVSKENMKKLFNKFEQFQASAESEKKGTGLGLIIAKGIIEAHKGRIAVGSVFGKGSTFYLRLPYYG